MEQPPPSEPKPRDRRRVIIILAVAAGVILIGGGLATTYFVSTSGERGPEQTVREYYAALEDADCNRIIGLFTEASWNPEGERTRQEVVAQCGALDLVPGQYKFEFEQFRLLSEDDNEAVVEVERRLVANPSPLPTAEFALRFEDGRWLIHSPAMIERGLGFGVFPAGHTHHPHRSQVT